MGFNFTSNIIKLNEDLIDISVNSPKLFMKHNLKKAIKKSYKSFINALMALEIITPGILLDFCNMTKTIRLLGLNIDFEHTFIYDKGSHFACIGYSEFVDDKAAKCVELKTTLLDDPENDMIRCIWNADDKQFVLEFKEICKDPDIIADNNFKNSIINNAAFGVMINTMITGLEQIFDALRDKYRV